MSLHAQLNPQAKAALAAQKRNSTISALIISLLAFGLVILILMVIALTVDIKTPPEIISYSSGITEEAEIERPETTNQVERKPSAPSSSMAKVIASNTITNIAIPVPQTDTPEPSMDFGNGSDFGDGWGDGEGWGSGGGGGSFFGRKTSEKLGVILDVSGSTRSTLLTVVKELEENFSSAAVVCVGGARISQTGSKISYPFQQEESWKWVKGLKNNLPVVEILSKFPDCHIPGPLKGRNRPDLSLAIELLLEKKLADEIYIFSDFADGPHDPALIEELTQKMLKKEIKLHMLTVTKAKTPNIEAFLPLSTKTNGTFTFFHELVGEDAGKKKKR